MKYIIVSTVDKEGEDDPETLVKMVQEKIDKGYKLVGGPAIRHGSTRGCYWAQAMTTNNMSPES